MNGVKQGSVLSPTLFCIYLDELLHRLETGRAGCRMGTRFCGALAYADDLTLISPSIKGLQSMIRACEEFGVEYDIVFNSAKTVCIMFGPNIVTPSIFMSGVQLVWKSKVKHLGNMLNSKLNDIIHKRGCLYQCVNKVIALFSSLPSSTVHNLFHTYCSTFYGSQLWNLNSVMVNDIYLLLMLLGKNHCAAFGIYHIERTLTSYLLLAPVRHIYQFNLY